MQKIQNASDLPAMTLATLGSDDGTDGFVRVRGARENNLRNVDVDVPRDALVVFTGVSGSGKSSLAFGTIYAEAQRRYFESVAPYARRLIHQAGVPKVERSRTAARGRPAAAPRHAQHARSRWAPSPRFPTPCACCFRAPATTRRCRVAGRGGLLAQHRRRGLPRVPRPGARYDVTEARWFRTPP